MGHQRISVIVPALNEQQAIGGCLSELQPLRERGHEVIVVDGGSVDRTVARAAELADRVLVTQPGRARQMNEGARVATGDILWFLHSDTRVPMDADGAVTKALEPAGSLWGRFDIQLSGQSRSLRIVAVFMNLRSRITGIATGDQGIFVSKAIFEEVGGFPDIPLMEDVAISQRLRRLSRPACLSQRLMTSSRRWESQGILRTILRMWMIRLGYALGVPPAHLARFYL